VAAAGKWVFFTGNWFAARTTKGGGTLKSQWQYVSSFTGFPDFCCDQVTIYDEARDRYFWLRMGSPSTNPPGTGNYENVFKLSVSPDGFLNAWTYTISPLTIDPSWTNQWWDYPHIQLGANYMYLAWNMFNQAGNWTQTVMLKIDLDVLAAAGPFSGSYFAVTDWFTFVPVQGAYHSTYFASNWPTTAANVQGRDFRIYKWDEDSGTITFVTRQLAATFLPTDRNDAVCGGTSGNWCARYDMRVLTGARYSINSDPIDSARYPGRKVVGWWWNVAQGGGFALPYIDAAAFFEDTLTQVSGFAGRPYIWGADIYCFAYPSISPNKRQDLGGVFHYSEGPDWNPYIAFTIADDYTHAPPGWIFYEAQFSNARPSDNKWGDYNTVREYEPTQKVWAGASHYIQKVNDCTNCGEPIYFVFGRDRDWPSWRRWKGK
jgi:hypothetical protein